MGSAEPLEVLVQRLTPTLSSGDGAPPVTEGLVKTTILEVAMRKSFSAKDGIFLPLVLFRSEVQGLQ